MAGLVIGVVFVCTLPFVVVAIKLTSKGPIFFLQERHTIKGRSFRIVKYRTMKTGTATDTWTRQNDSRITFVGFFLRKTRLDELPQCINLLRGEMSLVGPRPLPRESMIMYPEGEKYFYYMVPPGITGLWQVSCRSNTSTAHHASLNRWYVKNWDLWLDIMLLFKTVGVVMKRDGAC